MTTSTTGAAPDTVTDSATVDRPELHVQASR